MNKWTPEEEARIYREDRIQFEGDIDGIPRLEWLNKQHTRTIMRWFADSRSEAYVAPTAMRHPLTDPNGPLFTRAEIKAVLATREHLLNKPERKAIRQAK